MVRWESISEERVIDVVTDAADEGRVQGQPDTWQVVVRGREGAE